MNRRKFIGISVLSLGAIGITSLVAFYDFETFVLRTLKNDLGRLNIDEKHFKKFIEDARAANYWARISFTRNKQWFVLGFSLLPKIGLPYEFKYTQLRSRIVGDFLLASDFFVNKMDETRKIKYVGLYDPYLRPCQNPFSNLNYPAEG